jgi:type III restriction enzyme
MKFQFKVQQYQTDAVDAVVDCFSGQPRHDGLSYRIDPGRRSDSAQATLDFAESPDSGLRNAEIAFSAAQLLENVRAVQRSRNLPLSTTLVPSKAAAAGTPNLDIDMETGTGKTYVYIKTLMELNKRYGWSKFIVVVPSVAIREGVKKSFDITAEHFQQTYGTKPRSFINKKTQFQELERIPTQAFR